MIETEIMAYIKLKGMRSEGDIAVMASLQEMDKPFFIGKRGDVADEHPAANILHNHSKNKTKGMWMYLNY